MITGITAKHCISSIPHELHIINFARSCISSLRKLFWYTLCVMIYSPDGLMRYNDSDAIVDDMPLLSQWIKKFDKSKLVEFFWRRQSDLNRCIRVLQTRALPLGYVAIFVFEKNRTQETGRILCPVFMERMTRLELATSTLARWRSTRWATSA